MDEYFTMLCLLTKMPIINKGIFNYLLVEVLKYCRMNCLKNLDLNINELPIYISPEPETEPEPEPEKPKPKPKPVVLVPVPKIVKEP